MWWFALQNYIIREEERLLDGWMYSLGQKRVGRDPVAWFFKAFFIHDQTLLSFHTLCCVLLGAPALINHCVQSTSSILLVILCCFPEKTRIFLQDWFSDFWCLFHFIIYFKWPIYIRQAVGQYHKILWKFLCKKMRANV